MHRDTHADAEVHEGEAGQTMAEYAVVLSVITVAILLTIQLLGNTAGELINDVVSSIPKK